MGVKNQRLGWSALACDLLFVSFLSCYLSSKSIRSQNYWMLHILDSALIFELILLLYNQQQA